MNGFEAPKLLDNVQEIVIKEERDIFPEDVHLSTAGPESSSNVDMVIKEEIDDIPEEVHPSTIGPESSSNVDMVIKEEIDDIPEEVHPSTIGPESSSNVDMVIKEEIDDIPEEVHPSTIGPESSSNVDMVIKEEIDDIPEEIHPSTIGIRYVKEDPGLELDVDFRQLRGYSSSNKVTEKGGAPGTANVRHAYFRWRDLSKPRRKCILCGSTSKRVFGFPQINSAIGKIRCEQWMSYCLNWVGVAPDLLRLKHKYLCEEHFGLNQFQTSSKLKLLRTAVPTILSLSRPRKFDNVQEIFIKEERDIIPEEVHLSTAGPERFSNIEEIFIKEEIDDIPEEIYPSAIGLEATNNNLGAVDDKQKASVPEEIDSSTSGRGAPCYVCHHCEQKFEEEIQTSSA